MSHPDRVRKHYDAPPDWRRPSDNAAEQLTRSSHPKIERALLIEIARYCDGELSIREVSADALVAMAEIAAWKHAGRDMK